MSSVCVQEDRRTEIDHLLQKVCLVFCTWESGFLCLTTQEIWRSITSLGG